MNQSKKNGIKYKMNPQRANFKNLNTEHVRDWQNIKRSRAGDVSPELIYNYDETNLSDDPGRKKCIFRRVLGPCPNYQYAVAV